MSFLSMVEAKLPPGFRFHPRDDELVCDYLSPRASAAAAGAGFYGFPALVDIDLNKCEPWDLPETARIRGKEWYFYSVRDRKYATGQRTNRATVSGYWKATGKDRHVLRKGMLVGMRKTLVFYQGRAPRGKKTQWVMHEFRMEGPSDSPKFSPKVKLQRSEYDCKFSHFQSSQDLHGPASQQEGWVLCRVFYKSRSLSQKRSAEVCEEDTGSSSLPPLIDSQMMNYGQAPFGNAGLGQVPCFSSFSACQAAPPELITTERSLLPDLTSCLNSLSCDKKAMKVVLSQLSKMEDNQEINERCFSESAIPSLWNPFASF